MAVDMATLIPQHTTSSQSGGGGRAIGCKEVAMRLLNRKRNAFHLGPSDTGSCSSQQTQQQLGSSDSPCSSLCLAVTLPKSEGATCSAPAPCSTPADLDAHHRLAKRQRCAVEPGGGSSACWPDARCAVSTARHSQSRAYCSTAPPLDSMLMPPGASPLELALSVQPREALTLGRQASWPYFLSPQGGQVAQNTSVSAGPPIATAPSSFGPQTNALLADGSYATPANNTAPAQPFAPRVAMQAAAGRTAPHAAVPQAVFQQLLLNTLLSAPASYAQAFQATSGSCQSQLRHCQGIPEMAIEVCLPPGTASDAEAAALRAASFKPPFHSRLAPLQPLPEASMQPPLRPEQQAQLHALCDQLLSKTLAASALEESPVQQAAQSAVHRGGKIPALHGRLQRSFIPSLAARPPSRAKTSLPQAVPAAVGPAALLMQWAVSLALQQPDSIFFSMHLWTRLRDKVAMLSFPQRKGMLAGCLWVASKHEECRRCIPPGSRLSLVVGISVPDLNALELAVLGALGWSPMQGWDDGTHSKGQLVSPQDPVWSPAPRPTVLSLLQRL